MGAGDDILRRLAEFEATVLNRLDDVDRKVERLAAHLGANQPANGSKGAGGGGMVATLAQIQGQYGDPKVKSDPRDWGGPSHKGDPFSQCPPDYLELYADRLDFFGNKNEAAGDARKAGFDRLDAGRARRWAIEIREGRYKQEARVIEGPPPTEEPPGTVWTHGNNNAPPPDDGPPFGDDDSPF